MPYLASFGLISYPFTIRYLGRFQMLNRLILIAAVLWMSAPAWGAPYTLPSALGTAPFTGCASVTPTYYRCSGNVALGNGDTLTVSSALVLEVAGSFSAGNNLTIVDGGNGFQVNALGNISIGNNFSGAANLRAGGSVSIGNHGALTGNIIASGVLTLDNNTVVTGVCSPTHAQCAGTGMLSPAITFTKAASASPVDKGSAVSFTVLVRNDGAPGAATLTGVTVTDVFPCSGLTRGTPAVTQGGVTTGTCSGGSETLTWNVGSIGPGASATLTLPATGATPGSWVNTASLTSPSVLSPPPTQNAIVTVNALAINQVKMEVGDLTVIDTYSNPNWTQVNFTQVFDRTPYVFTLPTNDGNNTGAHRIRNVTTTGFQVTTVEPGRIDGRDGEDGPHVAMGLSYLAIDSCPGGAAQCTLTLSNGDKWQLGFVNTSRAQAYGTDKTAAANWERVNFTPVFSTPPAVLVQVQTLNNETGILNNRATNCPSYTLCPSVPWLTSAVNAVTAAQMDVALERSEARWGTVAQPEVIAYLAAAPTTGRAQFIDGAGNVVKYEIIRTPAQYLGWGGTGAGVYYTQNYSSTWAPDVPKVVASMNSRNNLETAGNNTTGDGGWLRRQVESTANQQTRVSMTVDEVRAGSFNTDGDRTKNNAEVAGIFAFNRGFAIDPVKLNQIRIVHDGAAQSCVAETIIVKACGDAACNATTLYTGPVTANLQPNDASANWTGTGVVGSTLDFSGGSGAANLRYNTAGSITLGLTATPAPANGVACYTPAGVATSCTMAVTACASQLVNACEGASCSCTSASCAANYDRLYTKLRGNALSFGLVALTQVSGQYVLDTGFSGTVQVDLVANQGAGACPTPASLSGLPSSSQNIAFSAGRPVASGTYTYAAASNVTPYRNLRLRFTQGAASTCSLDNFVIRPQAFTVTSSNATNNAASGTPIFKAGADSFSLTVTAVAGYDGTPLIDNAQLVGTPTAGTITGGFPAATVASGIATGNTFAYSEVGNLGLLANAIYDDSWTAVDQPSDCTNDASNPPVGKVGCKIGSTAIAQTTGSSGFGRFVPNHFDTVVKFAAGVPLPCPAGLTCLTTYNGFVYSGQPINVEVTAKNAVGTTTQNYQGDFARAVTLSAVATKGGTAIATAAPGGTLSANSVAATAFAAGVNTVTAANPIFTFTTVPTAPTDVYIRAVDADAVSSLQASASSSVEGGVKVVSGRIRMPNAYGSERLGLPMTATVQYYNAAGNWVTSLTDSSSAFGLSTPTIIKGPLALTNLTSVVPTDTCASSVVFCKGLKQFVWSSANVMGSADITLNAPSYLPGTSARATFGIYKSPLIYRRENY